MRTVTRLLLLLALATPGTGCADKTGRQPVSGQVTLKGVPVDRGSIEFDAADGALPTRAGAVVLDGRYQVAREQGLVPGAYRVRISAPDVGPAAGAPADPTNRPVPRERIPERYNRKSEVTVEVVGGAPNTFDFTID
ncbi:hypothetical protein [Gemmata sp.]|uniref:hypothetical protein n=1 Tax=Gemmata sp. TaxID=1914242 RepID=UPI003F7010B5